VPRFLICLVMVGHRQTDEVSYTVMCGRFTLHSRDRVKLKGLATLDLLFEARYNIAPSQQILAIADFGKGIEARMLHWGLIPSWSIDGKGFINARAETLEKKPSFSDSFRLRRCLIPADGFFEWRSVGRSKQPHYFQLSDESQFALAGIWDQWRNAQSSITSCAIITTAANELVEPLHDRMPAILKPDSYDVWLDLKTDPAVLEKLLAPSPASKMKSHPVSRAVNAPENDSEELIERVDAEVGITPSLF
jgi:putative SOS response-associated peptidase YedK